MISSSRRLKLLDKVPSFLSTPAMSKFRAVAGARADAAKHYLTHRRRAGRPTGPDGPRRRYDTDGLQSHHNHEFMADPEFQRAYARGVKATQAYYRWHWRVHIGS